MFYIDAEGIQAAPVLFSLNKSRNPVLTFGSSEDTYNNLFLTNCDRQFSNFSYILRAATLPSNSEW